MRVITEREAAKAVVDIDKFLILAAETMEHIATPHSTTHPMPTLDILMDLITRIAEFETAWVAQSQSLQPVSSQHHINPHQLDIVTTHRMTSTQKSAEINTGINTCQHLLSVLDTLLSHTTTTTTQSSPKPNPAE
ncbi:hypothetical protein BASA60_003317 [Batrachochytrium salamandrivorans]|nr:hypothetical protein BASA60_003317 [Batrachochytrium salamandrivorans]